MSRVETVDNEAGTVRFENGRTYFKGVVNGVPVVADFNQEEGTFSIDVSKPTGGTLSDGKPEVEVPVRVRGHRRRGDISANLEQTTYY